MKTIIKEDIKKFFTFKVLFLILGCLLFGIGERQSTNLSYQGYILTMVTDHYYLIYFMAPVFLFFIFENLTEDMKYILIRFKTYWRFFLSKVLGIIINVIGFIAVQLSIFLILGIGLPFNNSFELNKSSLQDMTLFKELYKHFQSPLSAILVSVSYMVLGLIVIYIISFIVNHFFSKKLASKAMITLYVLMIVGFKVPSMNSIPFLFMNNFFILHHNFTKISKILVSILSMLVLLILGFVLIKKYWNRTVYLPKLFKGTSKLNYYRIKIFSKKNLIIVATVVILISLWKLIKFTMYDEISISEYFISLFYEYGVNTINPLSFFEMLILNGTPLYLLSMFLEEESDDRGLPMTIRFNKKIRWVDKLLKNSIAFIGVYVIAIIIVGLLLSFLKGLRVENFIATFELISLVGLSRFLDIVLQFLLLFTLYTYLRNMTIAFLITISINMVLFLPWRWVIYFPIGISSIARNSLLLVDVGISFFTSIGISLVCNVIILIYIRKIAYKKLFK